MTQTTTGADATPRAAGRSGSVQSIGRAFGLLETMADHGGIMGLSQLAAESGLPLPTIHRLVRTLVELGYLRQEPSRQYVLGPKLIRLGESSSQMLSLWARPHLATLVDELGESANLAMLDGDRHAADPDLLLALVHRVAVLGRPGEALGEVVEIGDRVLGLLRHPGAGEDVADLARVHVGHQCLADRGAVREHPPADLGEHPHRVP